MTLQILGKNAYIKTIKQRYLLATSHDVKKKKKISMPNSKESNNTAQGWTLRRSLTAFPFSSLKFISETLNSMPVCVSTIS